MPNNTARPNTITLKAIELYSENNAKALAYAAKADMYHFDTYRYGKAVQDYLKSVELFSGPVFEWTKEDYKIKMYGLIGAAYRDMKQYGKAIDYFTKSKSIRLAPEQTEAYR